jgi:catechol 2,3-dioxygenase-like lactoylglutathione lyase family enzyme
MQPHISVITLGVADFDRAKRFYGDGLGWTAVQDYPGWVAYELNGGAVALGLHAREQLAADAGIDPAGSGFAGVTLSYIVGDDARVAGVLAEAEGAGGTIVQPATASPWGGTTGHFTDPDGYLWKVAAGNGPQPFAAE